MSAEPDLAILRGMAAARDQDPLARALLALERADWDGARLAYEAALAGSDPP